MNKLFLIISFFILIGCQEGVDNTPIVDNNSIPELKMSIPLSELILNSKEVDNSKINKDFSWESEDNISIQYEKSLNQFEKRKVSIELGKYDDETISREKFHEDKVKWFSKMIPDNVNGGMKKNNFYSKRIPIEKIGDSSYCYDFVSPTVVVLYKNYIIESHVTKVYVYENLSESNSSTLNKSIEIIKKQINKINEKGL
jgi:hypothetical protein